MKPTTLARNGVSAQTVELISRLVESIPWPDRRRAMGDVTASLLEGKPRVAECVFGWSRYAVELGMHEARSGMCCLNDLSARVKPRTEDQHPELLADIKSIMEPHSQSQASLRTTLLYTDMTARAVHQALEQKGWSAPRLPGVRTISNLLNRQNYRLRTVAKAKVQKKRPRPMPSLPTSGG